MPDEKGGEFSRSGPHPAIATRNNNVCGSPRKLKAFQTVKLSPQPHSALTFGLLKRNDSFNP